jgi:Ca2+-binding RTX toxin-like protein
MATIQGNANNNWLIGTSSSDFILGLAGDDTLKGGGGSDALYGGAGVDTVMYTDSTEGVVVSLVDGGQYGTAQGDYYSSIENVYGSNYGDEIGGDDNANSLYGLSGADMLKGGGGADMLDGGNEDDILKGGGGADVLIGGYGNDTISYLESSEGVRVVLLTGTGSFGEASGDTFSGIENVFGSDFEDLLVGDAGANSLKGAGGNDTLFGEGGDDVLDGGTGFDVMYGSLGSDTYIVSDLQDQTIEAGGQGIDTVITYTSYALTNGADIEILMTGEPTTTYAIDLTGNQNGNNITGNDGASIINGGDGRDTLTGRAGQDNFLFNTPLSEAFNIDRITDFTVADDTIRLDDAIFSSSLGLGNISSGEFVIGAAPQDANDRIIYNSGTGALYYDSDGNGGIAQVQFATLSAGLALTYLDFYVV